MITYLDFVLNIGTYLSPNLLTGDTADGFAFANFFPNVIQPPIAGLGNLLFALLVKVRICRRPIRRYDVGGGALAGGNTNQVCIPSQAIT